MVVFQALLEGMRADFLAELSERCDSFEACVLALEKDPADREAFNALYRGGHSLKGAGGTHGLPVVTGICHQLENLLSEADADQSWAAVFADRALALVDLVRDVEPVSRQPTPDYSAIEARLDVQRRLTLRRRKAVMIAESSKMMAALYQNVLQALPMQFSVEDDGLIALERLLSEPFDLLITGRELKTLNGIALMTALRVSQGDNREIPALLITSNRDVVPAHAQVSAVIHREHDLSARLFSEVRAVLGT